MRKENQWNDLFDQTVVVPSKAGFFKSLVTLVYHILRYIFKVIFWLAVIALVVNLIIHWKKILTWFRQILIEKKARRRLAEADKEEKDD